MRSIAHIINPFRCAPDSEHALAQTVTAKSMRLARDFSSPRIEVKLVAVTFPEDAAAIPEGFTACPRLEQSSKTIAQFLDPKKLPLLRELFEKGTREITSDVVVYTNIDIGVMPFFYDYIAETFATGGPDAIIINRRTITPLQAASLSLTQLYSLAGEKHSGCDCFVFRRELLDQFDLGNCLIGSRFFDRSLMLNLIAFSKKLAFLEDSHLTFHIGDDRRWNNNNRRDQDCYALREILRAAKKWKNQQSESGNDVKGTANVRRAQMLHEFEIEACSLLVRFDPEGAAAYKELSRARHSATHTCRLKEQLARFCRGGELLPVGPIYSPPVTTNHAPRRTALDRLLDLSPRKILQILRAAVE